MSDEAKVISPPILRCALCGRGSDIVRWFFTGPFGNVCGDCVAECSRQVLGTAKPVEAAVTKRGRKPKK